MSTFDAIVSEAYFSNFDPFWRKLEIIRNAPKDVLAELTKYAARYGENQALEWLLKNGYDPSGADGVRVLTTAANVGNLEAVKLLVEAGVDPLANEGEPLIAAQIRGHGDVIEFLESSIFTEVPPPPAVHEPPPRPIKTPTTRVEISDLPPELQYQVMRNLSMKDIGRLGRTSTYFNVITKSKLDRIKEYIRDVPKNATLEDFERAVRDRLPYVYERLWPQTVLNDALKSAVKRGDARTVTNLLRYHRFSRTIIVRLVKDCYVTNNLYGLTLLLDNGFDPTSFDNSWLLEIIFRDSRDEKSGNFLGLLVDYGLDPNHNFMTEQAFKDRHYNLALVLISKGGVINKTTYNIAAPHFFNNPSMIEYLQKATYFDTALPRAQTATRARLIRSKYPPLRVY